MAKILLSCLILLLLATVQTANAFGNAKEEQANSAHQSSVPYVKRDPNHVQTTSIRRPPSGPNPEGNFEVNAASQDVGKRAASVQNVNSESVVKKNFERTRNANAARNEHMVGTNSLRRPPSGPNPEGNLEVNAVSQDVAKRGVTEQNVDENWKKTLTRTLKGISATKDDGHQQLHTSGFRRPPSGPNPEGNFEVNAATQNIGKRGAQVQNVDPPKLKPR